MQAPRWQPLSGEMAEWLKAHAWKACLGETLTWVRIPLSPPEILKSEVPRLAGLARDFVCGRPQRSRPQNRSSSNPALFGRKSQNRKERAHPTHSPMSRKGSETWGSRLRTRHSATTFLTTPLQNLSTGTTIPNFQLLVNATSHRTTMRHVTSLRVRISPTRTYAEWGF